MLAKIKKVVSMIMKVPIDSISESSSPETIADWDSLHHMKLVMALEEEFGVVFSDQEIIEITSVEKIADTLRGKEI